MSMGIICGFACLFATLIAVACTQFDKLTAAILDIRQEHIMVHHGQEYEHVHTTANYNLQALLNLCIQHHQEIME
jgi:hypothetical protein